MKKKGERPKGTKGKPKPAKKKRIVLPTVRGNGVQPGVDIYNSASLLDLMDRYDHPEWLERKQR